MIDWNKEFPITTITRADLQEAGVPEAHLERLTDTDMQEIASMMEDIYLNSGYWDDLRLCVNRFFKADDEANSTGEAPEA